MSKVFGGSAPKFRAPAAVAPPPPAVSIEAAPVTQVQSGGDSSVDESVSAIRKKYRPSKGVGGTGTGLAV